ncbi:MAG: hypothetical protein AAGF95_00175 [Chloroflexota bacterium]
MKPEYNDQQVISDVSPVVRNQLHERIVYAEGDLDTVEEEIRAQIEEIDYGMKYHNETVQRRRRSDRAFFVAQLRYLRKHTQSLRAIRQPKSTVFKRIISFLRSRKMIPYNVP